MAVAKKKATTKKPAVKAVKTVAKPVKKNKEKESTTTKAKKQVAVAKKAVKPVKRVAPPKPKSRKGIGGRPSLGEDKKQRQQIFLEPDVVEFLEKFARKLSKSRGMIIRSTQLQAEIIEKWVTRTKIKQAKQP